jgi:hypothetical protein
MPVEKDKALTPEKKNLLVGQIELEIENINKAIREGGLDTGVLEAVKANKIKLQNVLNRLFEKRGVITPQETNNALNAIEDAKKSRLQSDLKRNLKRIAVFGSLALALYVGYKVYTKSKNG